MQNFQLKPCGNDILRGLKNPKNTHSSINVVESLPSTNTVSLNNPKQHFYKRPQSVCTGSTHFNTRTKHPRPSTSLNSIPLLPNYQKSNLNTVETLEAAKENLLTNHPIGLNNNLPKVPASFHNRATSTKRPTTALAGGPHKSRPFSNKFSLGRKEQDEVISNLNHLADSYHNMYLNHDPNLTTEGVFHKLEHDTKYLTVLQTTKAQDMPKKKPSQSNKTSKSNFMKSGLMSLYNPALKQSIGTLQVQASGTNLLQNQNRKRIQSSIGRRKKIRLNAKDSIGTQQDTIRIESLITKHPEDNNKRDTSMEIGGKSSKLSGKNVEFFSGHDITIPSEIKPSNPSEVNVSNIKLGKRSVSPIQDYIIDDQTSFSTYNNTALNAGQRKSTNVGFSSKFNSMKVSPRNFANTAKHSRQASGAIPISKESKQPSGNIIPSINDQQENLAIIQDFVDRSTAEQKAIINLSPTKVIRKRDSSNEQKLTQNKKSVSPSHGGGGPFAKFEEKWDSRRPTIEQRFDMQYQINQVLKQNDELRKEIQIKENEIEYQTWKNGQHVKKFNQLKKDDLAMRQDIITYDSYFVTHGDLQNKIPSILNMLQIGQNQLLKQMEVFTPQREDCLKDVIQNYEQIAGFLVIKEKQSKMTRAILGMARRIQIHVEMKAKSPAVFCDQYKSKERFKKFYRFFIQNEEYEEDKTDLIPRYEWPFGGDDESEQENYMRSRLILDTNTPIQQNEEDHDELQDDSESVDADHPNQKNAKFF